MPKNLGTSNEVSRAAAPGSPFGGQTYYDSGTGKSYIYDAVASKWRQYGGGGGVPLQTSFVKLASDITTTSTTFVDMTGITLTLTTVGGDLLVNFSFSISNTNANRLLNVRVMLDGVTQGGASTRITAVDAPGSGAIVLRLTGVSAGSHTVKVQWMTASATAQCRPVTGAIDGEHANLLVQEISN